jgi:hypothetical protein
VTLRAFLFALFVCIIKTKLLHKCYRKRSTNPMGDYQDEINSHHYRKSSKTCSLYSVPGK